jgi:hypothetical protein
MPYLFPTYHFQLACFFWDLNSQHASGLTDLTLVYLILCPHLRDTSSPGYFEDGLHIPAGPGWEDQCILGFIILCLKLSVYPPPVPIGLALCGSSHSNDILHLCSHWYAGKWGP